MATTKPTKHLINPPVLERYWNEIRGRARDCSPRGDKRATLSVLLVEDTAAYRKIVARVLRARGHLVTVARNGREAVDKFDQEQFDVVLMDVQMPIMDGYQATAAIRALEKGSDHATVIIAMTSHTMHEHREKCLAAGMDAYLAKPINGYELLRLLESIADPPAIAHSADAGAGVFRVSLQDKSRTGDGESGPSEEPVVLDWAGTIQRLAGDMDLFHDFIMYFDEDAPVLISALREAIGRDDAPAVHRAAHSLKGLAANLGANACAAGAHDLEQIGKSGNLSDASAAMKRLEAEITRLDAALSAYRRTGF